MNSTKTPLEKLKEFRDKNKDKPFTEDIRIELMKILSEVREDMFRKLGK